jgi:hypothetical protein
MKAIFTNDTDIRLGFEVECRIRSSKFTQFCKEIYGLKKKIIIGEDGSITGCGYSYHSTEIRTAPLPPKESMEVLKTVFNIVNKYGNTNTSCGLHVNISSADKTKMKNFNPLPFISSKLWNQILKKFNRENNRYCQTVLKATQKKSPSKVRLFKSMVESMVDIVNDKYWCVTLCHFGNGTNKSSRIEIRGFGNKNYTKRFVTISTFVKRIEKLFNLSCNRNSPFIRTFNI